MKINSKEYWDDRFKTNDWSQEGGKEQTKAFADIMLKNLPQWIISDIQKDSLSICDAGCAEGQGVKLFSDAFPLSGVCGFDFSQEAIKNANNEFPDCSFFCSDMNNIGKHFDVLLSSNTLEHFETPLTVVEKMLEFTNRHLVLLLPFRQDVLTGEHVSNFDFSTMPFQIDGFSISFYKVLDLSQVPQTLWNGLQILVIYTKKEYLESHSFTLQDFYNGYMEEENEKIHSITNERDTLLSKKKELEATLSEKEKTQAQLEANYSELNTANKILTEQYKTLTGQHKILTGQHKNLNNKYSKSENDNAVLQNSYAKLESFFSQELTRIYHDLLVFSQTKSHKVSKALRGLKKDGRSLAGILNFIKRCFQFISGKKGAFADFDSIDPVFALIDSINKTLSSFTNINSDMFAEAENTAKSPVASEPSPPAVVDISCDDVKIVKTKRKKIAYFTNQLLDWEDRRPRFGGGERYCLTLSRLLVELGFDVDIYQLANSVFEGNYYEFHVKTIICGEVYSEFNISGANAFYDISLQYDHVIYNLPELSAVKYRKDAITICHGIWFDHDNYGAFIKFRQPEWTKFLKRAFANPLKIVSVDTNSINVIRAFFPELAGKMSFIPNFVDTNQFTKPSSPRNNGKLKVLFPRRSQINRGSRILGDILKRVPHDVDFYWVGEGDDADTQIILNICKQDSRLHYEKASFDEMPNWYQTADIVVIPTIACEGTSLSCIEALSCGCATVATNVGGLTDIIYDNINGLLADATARSIASAVNKLIEDPKLRHRLQQSGYEYSKNFSLDIWKSKWVDIFGQLKWIRSDKKEKPDVVIITKNAIHGGVETLVKMEAEYLNADIIVAGGINNPENTCPFAYKYIDSYKKLLDALMSYDVAIYHWISDWAVQAVKLSGIPGVEFVHRTDTSECDKTVPAFVVSHSEYINDFLNETYGINNLRLVPNAADTNKYRPSEDRLSKKTIGAVTSYFGTKGIDILIDAWAILDKQYKKEYKLVLYGAGPELSKYRQKADALGVDIALNGPTATPETLYDDLFLYVTAARIEGLPVSILEAMSADIPIIASDIEGHTVINQLAQDSGFAAPLILFKTEQAKDLAAKIEDFIKNPKTVNTRAIIEKLFSPQAHGKALLDVITEAYLQE